MEAGIIVIFVGITALLWCIFPFAVFGIKPLLRKIHHELKDINRRGGRTEKK